VTASTSRTATSANDSVKILKSGGLTVERHADHFAHDTADEVWLAEIGKGGWIALTHDRRIRYKPNEREAVMRHGLALLVIVGNAPFPDLAHALVATIPRVEQFLASHGAQRNPGFIAHATQPRISLRFIRATAAPPLTPSPASAHAATRA